MSTLKKLRFLISTLPPREKVFFFVFFAIFLAGLFGLLWKINSAFLMEVPAGGGKLKEGIMGSPRFINPLLAVSDADRDLTALVYSGLMRLDEKGELIPDLAESYQISEDGLSYKFKLKEKIFWQDGEIITNDDVIFTVEMAKNSSLKSPRQAGWEGVEVEKINEREIVFWLKKPYAPFPENTTLGILPKHLWEKIPAEQFSLSKLNIKPVGSGPYKIEDISEDSSGIISSYVLKRYEKFALGKPLIKKLEMKFYPSEKALIKAFISGEVEAAGALSPRAMGELKMPRQKLKIFSLPRIFAVFFNQNQNPILAKKEVRQALALSADKEKIIEEVLLGYGRTLDSVIPPGSLGYLGGSQSKNSLEEAKELLEKNGWKFNQEEKIYQKKDKKENLRLEFSISTSNSPELAQTAEMLKNQWQELGAKVEIKTFEIGGLNQNVIRPRKYDALLFGMVVGRDPDPFAFWHSSQRNDPGLNIALYTNISADKILEEARTISDPEARKEKYQRFQEELAKDVPAVFLYSPQYLYLVPEKLKGLQSQSITVASERFSQIYKWYFKTKKAWKEF